MTWATLQEPIERSQYSNKKKKKKKERSWPIEMHMNVQCVQSFNKPWDKQQMDSLSKWM